MLPQQTPFRCKSTTKNQRSFAIFGPLQRRASLVSFHFSEAHPRPVKVQKYIYDLELFFFLNEII